MENFLAEYTWIAVLIVLIFENLVAASKLKSNSSIELVVNIIKFIFGLNKKEDIKLD